MKEFMSPSRNYDFVRPEHDVMSTPRSRVLTNSLIQEAQERHGFGEPEYSFMAGDETLSLSAPKNPIQKAVVINDKKLKGIFNELQKLQGAIKTHIINGHKEGANDAVTRIYALMPSKGKTHYFFYHPDTPVFMQKPSVVEINSPLGNMFRDLFSGISVFKDKTTQVNAKNIHGRIGRIVGALQKRSADGYSCDGGRCHCGDVMNFEQV